MKQISSFTIDHLKLLKGLYVSRKDQIGKEVITTFDIRITRPNYEPVIATGEIHTIEHLGATFLRNHPNYAQKTIYFGPMGCRTGFYLLLAGDYSSIDILPIITEMFEFIRDYEGDIPGASKENCGNFSDMNLDKAKEYAANFLDETLYKIVDDKDPHLNYPK